MPDDRMLTMLSEYLSGWELAVDSKIIDRDKDLGAFSKVAGFRFMILMLPAFYEQACNDKKQFTKDYIKGKINALFAQYGLIPSDLFDKDSEYLKNMGSNPFTGETPITVLAKDWTNKLKTLSSGAFDPLA